MYSGSMDRCMEFDQALSHYVNGSSTFNGRRLELKMINSQSIIEGVGYMCGKLEGRLAFQGIDEEIALSPYDVFISVNGQMYPFLEMDRLIPFDETIEVENYPASKKPHDEIEIFEKIEGSHLVLRA